MLKQRTPFTGRRVVRGQTAAKFPATVTVADKAGGTEACNSLAFCPRPPGVRSHSAGRGQRSKAASGWLTGRPTRSDAGVDLRAIVVWGGYGLHDTFGLSIALFYGACSVCLVSDRIVCTGCAMRRGC